MTQEEWTKKNRQAVNAIIKNNRPLLLASKTAMKDMALRIFDAGKKEDGSQIGQYDTTKPMYVNPDIQPRATKNKIKGIQGLKPTTGKHGEHLFKNGKEHKTTYVKSYADLRRRIGRPIDKVNLIYSGDLQLDFTNGKIRNPEPTKINPNEYIITLSREINRDKRAGLEKKYGSIFHHTKDEIAKFLKIADLELRNEFSKAGIK